MDKGKIVRLMDKGYGFIAVDGRDGDLFFHSNELNDVNFDDLKVGDEVELEIAEGQKGPNAVNVKRV